MKKDSTVFVIGFVQILWMKIREVFSETETLEL